MFSLRPLLPAVLSGAYLLVCPPLYAQEGDTLSAAHVRALWEGPVVPPAEETVLKELVSAPSQVNEILRRFTGVYVKDYGGAGGLKTVNIRSLGSEHTGIFIDGIQVDNAQNMQVDLGRFSTENLERIRLYTGQKHHRLQTAKEYVTGAAVHLESALPSALPRTFHARLEAGSFATFHPFFQYTRAWRSVRLRCSTSLFSTSGRYPFPCFDTTLVRENGDLTALRTEGELFGQLPHGRWQAHLYSYGSERGFPGPVIRRGAGLPFSAERQADQDTFLQGSWEQDWTRRFSTALRGKWSDNYTHYNTHPEQNPMALPYNLHFRQRSVYLSLSQSLQGTDVWSADLCTDVQYNTLDADVGQFVRPERTTFTGALAARALWERIRLAGHLAWQGAWDIFDAPDAGGWSRSNRWRQAWMPSITLWGQPFPWMEASAFVKRSYRLPSFNDLYYAQVGNARLEPEAAFQAGGDLGLRLRTGHADLHCAPYYNRVTNKIMAIPSLSQFRWTMLNVGVADITGADVRSSLTVRKEDWEGRVTLRYTWQRALDHSAKGSATYGNPLPYIPQHSGGTQLSLRWKTWGLSFDTLHMGHRWSRSARTPDYYLPPLPLLADAALRREGHWGGMGWTLRLTGSNLFNRSYQLIQGYPMPGLNVKMAVTCHW